MGNIICGSQPSPKAAKPAQQLQTINKAAFRSALERAGYRPVDGVMFAEHAVMLHVMRSRPLGNAVLIKVNLNAKQQKFDAPGGQLEAALTSELRQDAVLLPHLPILVKTVWIESAGFWPTNSKTRTSLTSSPASSELSLTLPGHLSLPGNKAGGVGRGARPESCYAFALELVSPGMSLNVLVKESSFRLSERQAAELCEQLLTVVARLHELDVTVPTLDGTAVWLMVATTTAAQQAGKGTPADTLTGPCPQASCAAPSTSSSERRDGIRDHVPSLLTDPRSTPTAIRSLATVRTLGDVDLLLPGFPSEIWFNGVYDKSLRNNDGTFPGDIRRTFVPDEIAEWANGGRVTGNEAPAHKRTQCRFEPSGRLGKDSDNSSTKLGLPGTPTDDSEEQKASSSGSHDSDGASSELAVVGTDFQPGSIMSKHSVEAAARESAGAPHTSALRVAGQMSVHSGLATSTVRSSPTARVLAQCLAPAAPTSPQISEMSTEASSGECASPRNADARPRGEEDDAADKEPFRDAMRNEHVTETLMNIPEYACVQQKTVDASVFVSVSRPEEQKLRKLVSTASLTMAADPMGSPCSKNDSAGHDLCNERLDEAVQHFACAEQGIYNCSSPYALQRAGSAPASPVGTLMPSFNEDALRRMREAARANATSPSLPSPTFAGGQFGGDDAFSVFTFDQRSEDLTPRGGDRPASVMKNRRSNFKSMPMSRRSRDVRPLGAKQLYQDLMTQVDEARRTEACAGCAACMRMKATCPDCKLKEARHARLQHKQFSRKPSGGVKVKSRAKGYASQPRPGGSKATTRGNSESAYFGQLHSFVHLHCARKHSRGSELSERQLNEDVAAVAEVLVLGITGKRPNVSRGRRADPDHVSSAPAWLAIGRSARALIADMLACKLSAKDAMQHRWLASHNRRQVATTTKR